MKNNNHSSRRNFIQQTSLAGAGLILGSPIQMFAQVQPMITNLPTRKPGQLEVSALGVR